MQVSSWNFPKWEELSSFLPDSKGQAVSTDKVNVDASKMLV
jgi:hypothetical protein